MRVLKIKLSGNEVVWVGYSLSREQFNAGNGTRILDNIIKSIYCIISN